MYDTNITLEPVTDFTRCRYGLITPDGKMYVCDYVNHCYLQSELTLAGKLKETSESYSGSVHISDYEFDKISHALKKDDYAEYYKDALIVTQAQLNTMYDYMTAHNKPFTAEGLTIKDAKSTLKTPKRPLLFANRSSAVR